MKHILTSLALCLTVSTVSHGMMNPNHGFYDEKNYSMKENANKNFTPVSHGEPGYDQMRGNYKSIAEQNFKVCQRGGYKTFSGINVNVKDSVNESINGSAKLNGNAIP